MEQQSFENWCQLHQKDSASLEARQEFDKLKVTDIGEKKNDEKWIGKGLFFVFMLGAFAIWKHKDEPMVFIVTAILLTFIFGAIITWMDPD